MYNISKKLDWKYLAPSEKTIVMGGNRENVGLMCTNVVACK